MNEPRNGNGLPESVLPLLRRAGWEPGRAVPVDPYMAAYHAEKIPWTKEVEEFLSEFGDLIIEYTTGFEGKDVLEFCARRAAQGIGRGGIEGFQELSGRSYLGPLGHCQFGTCLLFMADKGEILGGTDEGITFIGQTGKNAIGNVLTGAEPKVIGRFPSFEESFPATATPLGGVGRVAFCTGKSPIAEAHVSGSLQELDAVLSDLLGRYGFTRIPQKKSVSWTISQPMHAQGQPNVIFKLVDRAPMAVQFGVRKKWLEDRGLTEIAIGDEAFIINGVEFVGPTVTKDQSGQETILQILKQILI